MLGLLRLAVFGTLLIVTVAAAALMAAYGEVEPCRVLAAERASRTALPVPPPGLLAWERYQTSQMTGSACARDLLDSWGARLAQSWK